MDFYDKVWRLCIKVISTGKNDATAAKFSEKTYQKNNAPLPGAVENQLRSVIALIPSHSGVLKAKKLKEQRSA